MVHAKELQSSLNCCPKCDHHYRISADTRISILADEGSFTEHFGDIAEKDPLSFVDTESYADRIKRAKKKSGASEAVKTGTCTIGGTETALAVIEFSFMGGSMGSVVGERITRLIELATTRSLPLVIVSASGGARMQESIYSLMQMAKTSAALAKLSEAGLPYISILTNPTTGGVTASFASLGDVIIAEPKALIGFAGPRVIEQTIRQKLPETAQKSEFLIEKGMVDCVISRRDLKAKTAFFLDFLTASRKEGELAPSAYDKQMTAAQKDRSRHTLQV